MTRGRIWSAILGLFLVLFQASAVLGQESGRVTVDLGPPEAVEAGAAWSLDGGRTWRPPAGSLDLPAGEYTILFKDLAGWTKPAPYPLRIGPRVRATVEASYGRAARGGKLTVKLGPPGLAAREGRWSPDGGTTWHRSGRTAELPAGEYQVSFGLVGGWGRPAMIPVELGDGESVEITAAYGSLIAGPRGLLRVSVRPPEAAMAGARGSVDAGSNWFRPGAVIHLEPGRYRIIFRTLSGWKTPRAKETEVEKDRETEETGLYQEEG